MKLLLAFDLDIPASADKCGSTTAELLISVINAFEHQQRLVMDLGSARVLGYYKGLVREPELLPQRTTHIIAFELSQPDHRLANATLERIDSLLGQAEQSGGPDLGEAQYVRAHFATLVPATESSEASNYVNHFAPGTKWRWTSRAMQQRHPDPEVIKTIGDQAICRDSNGNLFRIHQAMNGLTRQAISPAVA